MRRTSGRLTRRCCALPGLNWIAPKVYRRSRMGQFGSLTRKSA